MVNRKFDAKLRKVGNSFVITIPKETIDRFKIKEGDYVAISINPEEIKKEK